MSWGYWKKFKNLGKKVGSWIGDKLRQAKPLLQKGADFLQKAKPVMSKIEFSAANPKLDGFMKKVDVLSDDLININNEVQKGDYGSALNYAGRQFVPKFKR